MTAGPLAALLVMWVTFTALALAGAVAALVWAVRSRQFSNQDEARYLPLDEQDARASGKPEPTEPESHKDATDVSP